MHLVQRSVSLGAGSICMAGKESYTIMTMVVEPTISSENYPKMVCCLPLSALFLRLRIFILLEAAIWPNPTQAFWTDI